MIALTRKKSPPLLGETLRERMGAEGGVGRSPQPIYLIAEAIDPLILPISC
jgi:hypothetical protein